MAEERRIVTVLFADVAGSTELGESLDPEDARALLGRYYTIARDVVSGHGGTIEKFIGDAVMAVFGLPQAHGDDVPRALSTALELRERVRTDGVLGDRFPIRFGISTGEVVARRDRAAGSDFLITGDAVNISARLQQAADPWAILCTERTLHAAGTGFAFGPLTSIDAKGKRTPVRAAVLLGRAALPRPRVPLIGRDTDLAQLELVARRAFAERRPFVVSLIAPAGTGKTRLLEEFLERLSRLAPETTLAVAQCLPYGQRLTYWPLRAVLCSLVGVDEEADPEAIREAVRAWLRARGSEQPDRTADLLATTVGFGESEIADRAALLAAWRNAVELASRQTPLVLIFEDLHWSSDSLLDLVEFVMQPRGEAAVMMIALTRPELLDRRPVWGGGQRNYVSLVLEPLRDAEIETLVRHMLPAPSRDVVARIAARAEGNPFYAGELVRSLIDRVGVSVDGGAAIDQALAVLPDTIQATVLARLDLLPPGERRALQLGAVFGRAFRSDGVVALAPDLTAEIDRLIEVLLAKDLVRHAGMENLTFRHILIREVAYQTLPRAERARFHGAAAAWLEGHAGGREDALAELIAYHCREAASLTSALGVDPAVVGGIRQKAVHWLTRAADVAAAGAATMEAARHLRSAIEFAGPGDLPDLYERLGHEEVGRNSATAYLTALRLCREQHRSPDQKLRVLARLLTVYMRFLGSIATRPSDDEMARLLAEGDALLQAARDDRAVARFLIAKGFHAFWLMRDVTPQDITQSEASARRGLEIAEKIDDAELRSAALDALGGCAEQRGEWTRAGAYALQRLEFQNRLSLLERIDAHSVIAWCSSVLGDLDEAIRISASGLGLLQPGQVPAQTLHLVAWRIYALTVCGLWDDALAAGNRAHELWIEIGRPSTGYAFRGFIAALDVARARRIDDLIDRYQDILAAILRDLPPGTRRHQFLGGLIAGDVERVKVEMVGEFGFWHMGSEYLERGLSFIADRRQPPDAHVVRPIAELATVHGYRPLEAQARRALGMALRDPMELTRAIDLFERIGAGPYAARTRCERALLVGDEAGLAAGMQVLTELGDLDQLERIEHSRG